MSFRNILTGSATNLLCVWVINSHSSTATARIFYSNSRFNQTCNYYRNPQLSGCYICSLTRQICGYLKSKELYQRQYFIQLVLTGPICISHVVFYYLPDHQKSRSSRLVGYGIMEGFGCPPYGASPC